MADRFKFRCYVTENDRYPDKVGYVNTEGFYIHPEGEESFFDADYDFAECIIEQCTGLRDKNGKLIYEGDWLKTKDGYYCYVEWIDGFWWVTSLPSEASDFEGSEFYKECEVIGNIHENKDLLDEA